MKLIHTADLHIGRKLHEASLMEDQAYILERMIDAVREEKPQLLVLAGDIYDKSIPPSEASVLLDTFLTRLAALDIVVCMVSGNHDSSERLDFGSRFFEKSRLYIAGTLRAGLTQVELEDEHGPLTLWLLPFIKPAVVRHVYGEAASSIKSYDEAVRFVLSQQHIDTSRRNILVAHQFVTSGSEGPQTSDSEILSLGGQDNIDVSAFESFDYVALGHIHRPQSMGRPSVRYSGSPLKYSFSEVSHRKGISIVELGRKNEDIVITHRPLVPLRDVREIRGPLAALLEQGRLQGLLAQDYIRAILTDEEEEMDVMERLRSVYPNTLTMSYDNSRTRSESHASVHREILQMDPLSLFERFYTEQNGTPLEGERKNMAVRYLKSVQEEQQ